MKTNKYISIILMTTLWVFGLNSALSAKITDEDQLKNEYIEAHTPVFATDLAWNVHESSISLISASYDDEWIGTIGLSLTNPAEDKYNLYVWKQFLGYSNKNSDLQLFSQFSCLSDQKPFGVPIPLKPGIYERKDTAFGHDYRVTIKVETMPLDIKTLKSGYTQFDASYGPAIVYLIAIENVEQL